MHDHPPVESKVQKAEEKLFWKVTVKAEHVLRQYLPQKRYHVQSTTETP